MWLESIWNQHGLACAVGAQRAVVALVGSPSDSIVRADVAQFCYVSCSSLQKVGIGRTRVSVRSRKYRQAGEAFCLP